MTERGPNPLNPLLTKFQKLQQSLNFDARWEAGRALFLLKTLGLSDQEYSLRDQDAAKNLTFSAINSELSLPMVFACHPMQGKLPVHRDVKHVHPVWFKKFSKLPVAVVYFELLAEYTESRRKQGEDGIRPFCMVFPRKGFPQGLCIHDGPLEKYLVPGEGVHLYSSKRHARDFVVQPFVSVAKIISNTERDDDGDE